MQPAAYQSMHEVESRHWWFTARRHIFNQLLTRFLATPNPRIVDVGCGTGGNLDFLARHGEVLGLEPNPVAAQLASSANSSPVAIARLPQALPLASDSADLVTLLDVLEHIEDDLATLQTLHTILRANGQLLISVPAFPFLFGAHDRRLHHRRRYTRKGLEQLLQEADYSVDYLGYFNCWLFPPAVIARLAENLFATGSEEETLPPDILNRLLGGIFRSESWFLRRGLHFPFGLSLLALARK
jgi:SAM-dependent methyltransferase